MPRIAPLLPALALIALAVASPSRADAAFQLDQYATNSNTTLTGTVLGQSFTPGLNQIIQVTFFTPSAGPERSYGLTLYEGSGFGGTILATTTASSPGPAIGFDFGAIVPLSPGSIYTLAIRAIDGNALTLQASDRNSYTRGMAFGPSGPISGTDLSFSEFASSTATAPEPSSLLLVGLGAAGLVPLRRLAQRRTT